MSDAFVSQLLYLATVQLVTKSAPYSHSKTIPLHALSHLVADYLQLLASAAKANAERAGRDKASVWDVARALEEFGTGTLSDLRDDVEHSDGGGDEGERLRDLAGGLKDLLDPQPVQEPVARLGYHPLTSSELDALATLQNEEREPALDDDSSGQSSDEDPELLTPAALSPARDYGIKRDPFDLDLDFESLLAAPKASTSSWRDPALIPGYVPDFLPPFPGMERETDIPEPVRRRRERERERDAAAAAWAGANEGSDSVDPWIATVPYAASHLAESHPPSALPPPNSPPSLHLVPSSRRRRRSLSPEPKSSIDDFEATAIAIGLDKVEFQRINPKRRMAASAISGSGDFALFGDSLFANVPVPQTRHAGVTAGYLPDTAQSLTIHPFNTSLPHTIATSVPKHPAPHARLLAPSIHPRIPSIMGSVASQLAVPSAPNLALFNRLTRIGPPGPLGPSGEATNYEYIGNSAVLEMSVEWAQRAYNHRLPARPRGDADGDGDGSTGIKLQLKVRGGSVPGTAAPSPAATPGGSWPSTFGEMAPVPEEEGPVASGSGSGTWDSDYLAKLDAVMASDPAAAQDSSSGARYDTPAAFDHPTPAFDDPTFPTPDYDLATPAFDDQPAYDLPAPGEEGLSAFDLQVQGLLANLNATNGEADTGEPLSEPQDIPPETSESAERLGAEQERDVPPLGAALIQQCQAFQTTIFMHLQTSVMGLSAKISALFGNSKTSEDKAKKQTVILVARAEGQVDVEG
ncbi:hypothetical protein RQP46_000365 [Phenoliferia psychrophenolica]